jgi:hypothetical protein
MLTDTQTLSKDTATDVDTNTTVFTKRFADSDKSVFSVSGITLPEEKRLTVSHEIAKGDVHRDMVKNERTVVDAQLVPATGSVHIVFTRPSSTALTNAIMIELTNQLIDFLIEGGSNANVTAVLNSEV